VRDKVKNLAEVLPLSVITNIVCDENIFTDEKINRYFDVLVAATAGRLKQKTILESLCRPKISLRLRICYLFYVEIDF